MTSPSSIRLALLLRRSVALSPSSSSSLSSPSSARSLCFSTSRIPCPTVLCSTSAARYASSAKNTEAPKFSKSAAFQGRGSRGSGVSGPAYEFDYYDSDRFNTIKLLSPILSLFAIALYFGYLREPSDLDEILSKPEHEITCGVERRMLRQQIFDAQAKGESTRLLEEELAYVDVKEAALKVHFAKRQQGN